MIFDKIFDRFIQDSPISVMVRGALEYALSAQALDALFTQTAERQYTRELLFSTVVDVMSLVVCSIRPSVHAAYQALQQRMPVSLTSLYNKPLPLLIADVASTHALMRRVKFADGA